LRDFVEGHGGFVAHIDFHSFSSLVLYPWGHTYDAAPDAADLSSIAAAMSNAIAGVTGYDYAPIQGSDLYPASGVVDDWSYGEHDMRAFTIELRGDDFVVSSSQIAPACDENIAAALVVADWALEHHGGAGDDGGSDTGGGTDEAGDEHPDPTLDDEAGHDDAAGTTGHAVDDDGNADAPDADDDDAGEGEGDQDPDALPPGFGIADGQGSACRVAPHHDRKSALLLLAIAATRRRRRAQGM
jgi:hypothetical protein